jgi:hypothetical protein
VLRRLNTLDDCIFEKHRTRRMTKEEYQGDHERCIRPSHQDGISGKRTS